MKKSFTLIALLALGAIQAQDTLYHWHAIDAADKAIHGYADQTLAPNVTPGNSGLGQTWIFSTVAFEYTDTMTCSAMGWVPSQYTSAFPQSNSALYYGTDQTTYDFVHNDASGFYFDGTAFLDPNFGVMSQEFSDPLQYMKWPMRFGTSFSDTAYSSWKYPTTGPSDSAWEIMTVEMTAQVDAQGTLITSYGTYDILRVRRDYEYWIQVATHDASNGWSTFSPANFSGRVYEFWTDSIFVNWYVASIVVNPANDAPLSYAIMIDFVTDVADRNTANELAVYPNPATDKLYVSGEENSLWEIFDLSGRSVLSGTIMTRTEEIDISALAKGMYVMRMRTPEGEVGSAKFVVE